MTVDLWRKEVKILLLYFEYMKYVTDIIRLFMSVDYEEKLGWFVNIMMIVSWLKLPLQFVFLSEAMTGTSCSWKNQLQIFKRI